MEGGNTQGLTINDAVAFLVDVKETFHDNTPTYDDFLNVLKNFKARRIDVAVVMKRVEELFKDHRELIFGFNFFLPRGYDILIPLNQDPSQTMHDHDEAMKYLTKIKTRFEGEVHVYKSFLDMMTAFRSRTQRLSTRDHFEQVSLLFKGHDDLITEFLNFVPGPRT